MNGLVAASLRHFRALHALVICGIAIAVAVLAGALLVGASVRGSLRDLALARLGATELVATSPTFFRDALAQELTGGDIQAVAPLVAMTGTVTHDDSGRIASHVQVFGIDDRFLAFHGRPAGAPSSRDSWISPALATELGADADDNVMLRIAKPSDVPLSTLQGRREDVSERVRLTVGRVVDRAALGEFSLLPSQGPALTMFVALSRLQQDLDAEGRVNVLLLRMAAPAADPRDDLRAAQEALSRRATLDDLGLKVRRDGRGATVILESRSGLLPDSAVASAVHAATQIGRPATGVLTYLANAIRANGREIPYSLIAAIDLPGPPLGTEVGVRAPSGTEVGEESPVSPSRGTEVGVRVPVGTEVGAGGGERPILLNAWAAEDLGVTAGDRIDVDYFLWTDSAGLQTRSTSFTYAGVVPMTGPGGDATLTPEYPGITDAADVTNWDPPFPVDMRRVRKTDEDYWDTWRAAPKAFIPLAVGQQLWASPFGKLSSLRTHATEAWPAAGAFDIASLLPIRPVRAEAMAAAAGTTDFGEYFVYFSFFLVVSALLLAGMFFALTVEQRARELGLLIAVGFTPRDVRRTLLREAAVLITIGSTLGVAGAIGYAALIVYGLGTWWVGAVGTTALRVHIDPMLLGAGVLGAALAAAIALTLSMRRLAKRTTRALLTAGFESSHEASPRVSRRIAAAALALSLLLMALAGSGMASQVAAFFGAGALLLVAGCAVFAAWLRSRAAPTEQPSMIRFGAAYARWRPARSVLSTALIAFACFVIVSVGAFRRDPAAEQLTRDGGTGGFLLMGESVAPLLHNPNTPGGRDELLLGGYPLLEQTSIARWRLRPGDEASCLTLYQPANPRIVAPEDAFLQQGRFSFAGSVAETPEERANPWLLLNRQFADGAVAAIADQTSLTYVFHLKVGDDLVLPADNGPPIRLRIVATLADSVLQSELIIGEGPFIRLFPHHEGYRLWLIEGPEAQAPALTALLEDSLSDFGMDIVDTRARLAAYHQVENTYLSTFQSLGALGLLLGTLGLAAVLARNVLERRRELGLLGAVGFTNRHLRTMIASESILLVATGLVIGSAAAILAVAPAVIQRSNALPWASLALLLLAVLITGVLASLAAVRLATATPVVAAIKGE
ncbi:MAG TPA: ABC transporter permease [Vicinamibacterales bacterium]|nr:ABC transporter permease [Vicinamibacterales bacterium]